MKNSGLFSKVLVVIIFSFLMGMGIWAMWIMKTTTLDTNKILSIVYAGFSGELLLLLIKRLMSEDSKSPSSKPKSFGENETGYKKGPGEE